MHKLKDITLPILDSDFSRNLAEQFRNIHENFQKLGSPDLLRGADGRGAQYVPYNLNSILFYPGDALDGTVEKITKTTQGTPANIDLIRTLQKEVEVDYNHYNTLTGKSKTDYAKDCKVIYEAILTTIESECTPTELLPVNGWYFDWVRAWMKANETEALEIFNKHITDYSLGRVFVATTESDIQKSTGSLPYLLLDPRFRGGAHQDLEKAKDTSGIFVGEQDGTFKFRRLDLIPRMYFENGEFFWILNGRKTKVSAQGLPGKAGKNSSLLVVRRLENTAYSAKDVSGMTVVNMEGVIQPIPGIPMPHQNPNITPSLEASSWLKGQHTNDSNLYRVWRVMDGHEGISFFRKPGISTGAGSPNQDHTTENDLGIWDDKWIEKVDGNNIVPFSIRDPKGNEVYNLLQEMDKTTVLVLPDPAWQQAKYSTTFWIAEFRVLKVTNGEDERYIGTVYCGEDNRIELGLDEHTFTGMMMGLDPYEHKTDKYADHNKPRGLYIPIGSRKYKQSIDATGADTEPEKTWAAHVIYSEAKTPNTTPVPGTMTPNAEDRATMKETLHIGSVKDIRALNKSTKTNPGVPGRIVGKQEENNSITDDTGRAFDYTHYIGSDLSVDVPTTITSYKNTSGPVGPLLTIHGDLLTGYTKDGTVLGGVKATGIIQGKDGGVTVTGGPVSRGRNINYTVKKNKLRDHIYTYPLLSGIGTSPLDFYSVWSEYGIYGKFLRTGALHIGNSVIDQNGATLDVPEIRSYNGRWTFHTSGLVSYGIDRTDDLSTKSGYRHNGVFFNNRTTKKTNPTKNEVFVDDTIHHGAIIADSQSYTEVKDHHYSGTFLNGFYAGGKALKGTNPAPVAYTGRLLNPSSWSVGDLYTAVWGELTPNTRPNVGPIDLGYLVGRVEGTLHADQFLSGDTVIVGTMAVGGNTFFDNNVTVTGNIDTTGDYQSTGSVKAKAFSRKDGDKAILLENGLSTTIVSDQKVQRNYTNKAHRKVTKSPIVLDLGPTYGSGRLVKFGLVGAVEVDREGTLMIDEAVDDHKGVFLGQFSSDSAYYSETIDEPFGRGSGSGGSIEAVISGGIVVVNIRLKAEWITYWDKTGLHSQGLGINGDGYGWKSFIHDIESKFKILPEQFRPSNVVTYCLSGGNNSDKDGGGYMNGSDGKKIEAVANAYLELGVTPQGRVVATRGAKVNALLTHSGNNGHTQRIWASEPRLVWTIVYPASGNTSAGNNKPVYTKYVVVKNVNPENISFTSGTYYDEPPTTEDWILLGEGDNILSRPTTSSKGWTWSIYQEAKSNTEYGLSTGIRGRNPLEPVGLTKAEATDMPTESKPYKWTRKKNGNWSLSVTFPGYEVIDWSWEDAGSHQVMNTNKMATCTSTDYNTFMLGKYKLKEVLSDMKQSIDEMGDQADDTFVVNFVNGRIIYNRKTGGSLSLDFVAPSPKFVKGTFKPDLTFTAL